ncbi:MAG TPA: pyridoxamine 5'-phosphate oxidase family protein [Candidatus Binataceae bacterium]|nr:pyridoxamine 5'-phosphate oxidase family protein [Candidatus Binataceae bacterium]
MSDSEILQKFHDVAKKATWAYLATSAGDQPKVRVVHPAFESSRLWIATGRTSAKAAQIAKNPKVELFYQVGPEFLHLTVTGNARFIDDTAEKKRVWEGKIFDYDLAQFWPGGHQAPDFGLILVTPSRIELTSMPEMMQGKKPLLWRAKNN